MGFYPKGPRGTIIGPVEFNPKTTCVDLFRAMRGVGADNEDILRIIAGHTASQRKELKDNYRYSYKKDLREALNSELCFNFGKVVDALMADPEDYVLECIHNTLMPQKSTGKKLARRFSQLFSNGLGKDEYVLIDLLCYKSNEYLEAVKKAYKEKFGEDLEKHISNDEGNLLSQDFRNILQDMLTCERDESEEIDEEELAEDLDDLEVSDVGEVAIQTIFQERSYPHIRKLAVEFRKMSKKALERMIEESRKFSQEQKSTYVSILMKIKNENHFYAERLKAAFDGIGTDDDALIRIVVLRSELDLLDIMDAYKKKYGNDLASEIVRETSGEYQDILLRIIRVPESNELDASEEPENEEDAGEDEEEEEEEEEEDEEDE